MAQSNPNKANQYQFDPRQKLCWDFYVNPKSETFGNATQSAIKAGYTPEYADDIKSTDWFCTSLWRLNATMVGEKKLRELMELDLLNGGEKVDVGIAKIQADLTKFIAQTQGKDNGWSSKTEIDLTTNGESINSISTLSPEAQEAIRKIYEEETKKKILNP